MGCYRCGGEGGTETRLCSECTAARLEERNNRYKADSDPEVRAPARSLSASGVLTGLCVVLLVGIGVYYTFFSATGPGYALPPEQRVLARCRASLKPEQIKRKIMNEKFPSDPKGPAGDIAVAMQGAMAEMMGGFGDAICQGLAEECKTDPDGEKCRAILSSM